MASQAHNSSGSVIAFISQLWTLLTVVIATDSSESHMVAFNEENDGLPVRGQTAEMSRRRPKAAGLLDGRCAPENFTCPTR